MNSNPLLKNCVAQVIHHDVLSKDITVDKNCIEGLASLIGKDDDISPTIVSLLSAIVINDYPRTMLLDHLLSLLNNNA